MAKTGRIPKLTPKHIFHVGDFASLPRIERLVEFIRVYSYDQAPQYHEEINVRKRLIEPATFGGCSKAINLPQNIPHISSTFSVDQELSGWLKTFAPMPIPGDSCREWQNKTCQNDQVYTVEEKLMTSSRQLQPCPARPYETVTLKLNLPQNSVFIFLTLVVSHESSGRLKAKVPVVRSGKSQESLGKHHHQKVRDRGIQTHLGTSLP